MDRLGIRRNLSRQKSWRISSIGVELKGTNASSILSRVRDELKAKKKLKDRLGKGKLEKGEKKSLLWREDIKSKKRGIDVTLFGFSAPIVKHGESDRLMSIDFNSREPFEVTYQLLKGE